MPNPNNCRLVEDYHDGLLAAEGVAQFEKHLVDCENCQAQLTGLRSIDADVVAAWHHVEVAGGRIDVPTRQPATVAASTWWQVAAAVLLLAGIAWLLWPRIDEPAVVEFPAESTELDDTDQESGGDDDEPVPVATIRSRPMFAVATFPDNGFAEVVESTPEFTVYSVIPNNSYSSSSEER